MEDIYGRELAFGGGFHPEGTVVSFATDSGEALDIGAVVNNVTINYQQALSRIWDLGSGATYFVAGRTNGTFGMGTVATAGGLNYDAFGKICEPATLTFSGEQGFCGPEGSDIGRGGGFVLHDTILSQVGVSINSSDMIISQATSGVFLALSKSDEDSTSD